jgi:predicted ATP-grasp superfamily ATP-dependent carboligase
VDSPLNVNEKSIIKRLTELFEDPSKAAIILAAAKLDEDIAKGLVPPQFKDVEQASKEFADRIIGHDCENKKVSTKKTIAAETAQVNLPPFLKKTLLSLL